MQHNRKGSGIVYTPKRITRHMVSNTLGSLCDQRKHDLGIVDADYEQHKVGTIQLLRNRLLAYRNWLLSITICDPSCGHGAFLHQAFGFLVSEHLHIDSLQSLLSVDEGAFTEIENSVLENNLFGVDIDREAVEVARSSLLLRANRSGIKLLSLNDNIKWGDSLIDDPLVAGDSAFDWRKEFPKVFTRGGFDVVIGNPPYVGEKGHAEIFENLKRVPKWRDYYRRRSNTYYFFIKLGLDLLKEKGVQSIIIPREFTSADWANRVRNEIICNSRITSIVDFHDVKVFDEAGTSSLILTHTLDRGSKEDYSFRLKAITNKVDINSALLDNTDFSTVKSSTLGIDGSMLWNFYQKEIKVRGNLISLSELFNVSQGLVTGANHVTKLHVKRNLIDQSFLGRGIFILKPGLDYRKRNAGIEIRIGKTWQGLSGDDMSFLKPFIKTEHLKKWSVANSDLLVFYIGGRELTLTLKKYLWQFAGILLNRSTTLPKSEIITLGDFKSFSESDIKEKYSSAGTVQRVMRGNDWFLPFYERAAIPFGGVKLIVNTKKMDNFTFSPEPAYASGGGAGGQNFIYPDFDQKYWETISQFSNEEDYTLFVGCLLNSRIMQEHISSAKFNQLSTTKLGMLPVVKIDPREAQQLGQYGKVVSLAKDLIQQQATRAAVPYPNEAKIDKIVESMYTEGRAHED